MAELVDKKFGEGEVNLKVEEGKLKITVGYDGKGVDGGVYIDVEADYFLDKLAEAIPGEIDDMIINAIKGAMK